MTNVFSLLVRKPGSKKTARSKGYAFVQFKYPEVADIVSETMNGYMLMGKVMVSNTRITKIKRANRKKRSGKKRKAANRNKETTLRQHSPKRKIQSVN